MSKRAARAKISFVPRHTSDTKQTRPLTSMKTTANSFHDGAQLIPSTSLSILTPITPHLSNPSKASDPQNEPGKQEKLSTVNHQSVVLSMNTKSESNTEAIVKAKSASTCCCGFDLVFLLPSQLNWNTDLLEIYLQNNSSFSKSFLSPQSS